MLSGRGHFFRCAARQTVYQWGAAWVNLETHSTNAISQRPEQPPPRSAWRRCCSDSTWRQPRCRAAPRHPRRAHGPVRRWHYSPRASRGSGDERPLGRLLETVKHGSDNLVDVRQTVQWTFPRSFYETAASRLRRVGTFSTERRPLLDGCSGDAAWSLAASHCPVTDAGFAATS